MSFSGAIDQIITHCTAAGTAITPAITDIRVGDPGAPPGECIAISYTGDVEPVQFPGGRTLNMTQLGEHLAIRAYWPVSDREQAIAKDLELRVQALRSAIEDEIRGNSLLAGEVTDLDLDHAVASWAQANGTWYRILEQGVTLTFADDTAIVRA